MIGFLPRSGGYAADPWFGRTKAVSEEVDLLQAINCRKARLSASRGAGTRVPTEDIVTSTIFGPLEFMSPEDRLTAFDCLADALDCLVEPACGMIVARFWPRLALTGTSLRARYSEPDLVIADDLGALMILEIKWDAPLSEHELAAQWAALPSSQRRRSRHVLLVQEPGRYRTAVEEDGRLVEGLGLAPWQPLIRTWRTLAGLPGAAIRRSAQSPVRSWAAAVADFVRREHRFAMQGWDHLGLTETRELGWRFVQPWFQELGEVDEHGGAWADE